MSKNRNIYRQKSGCLSTFIDILVSLVFLAAILFLFIKSDSHVAKNPKVLAYKMRFQDIAGIVCILLILPLWSFIQEYLCSGKKEKEFWETKTWRKKHNSKNWIEEELFDFLGPAGYFILIAVFILTLFFARTELTSTSIRQFNFLNIKTMEISTQNIYKAEIGIESHHRKSSTSYNTFIKIYAGKKCFKLDSFNHYDILTFYKTYQSVLSEERIIVSGQKYLENYLSRKSWPEKRKDEFRKFINQH